MYEKKFEQSVKILPSSWKAGEDFLKEVTVDLRTQGWAGVNEEKQGGTAYAKAQR